ncbi:MAG: S24 family peptidase [Syntrophobacteraceae bacterium]|jgi:phage repressor protein C with HTH and peptisase S24 domain
MYESMSNQKMTRKEKISLYAQRLKHVRRFVAHESGVESLSQAKFAKMLHVHPSIISHIEAGTTRIQPEMAKTIEEKTGFRQAWLLTGEDPQRIEAAPRWETLENNSYTVSRKSGHFSFSLVQKVKPRLSSGTGELVDEEESEDIYSFRREWLTLKGSVPFMRLAQVSGDSMFPTLKDGDFVLFDTSKGDPQDGKIMVIGIENLLYIKRVRVSPEGIFLVSDNKAVYEPWRVNPENTRYLGLVIWHCGDV